MSVYLKPKVGSLSLIQKSYRCSKKWCSSLFDEWFSKFNEFESSTFDVRWNGVWTFSIKNPCLIGWRNRYSEVSNNRTVSNKSIQGCNFELLLHKNARFWPFLAHSCHEINSRTCTFIKDLRVNKYLVPITVSNNNAPACDHYFPKKTHHSCFFRNTCK